MLHINLTDHNELRGSAIIDFARGYGKFEGLGDKDLANLHAEKIFNVYSEQISQPVSEAWSKLPKVSTLVEAVKEGFALAEAPLQPEAIELFEKSIRQVFERAVPALRELSINATIQSDTLQSLTGNLMSSRDEAVETLKANGDGIFGALTRRINVRKAEELHHNYLSTATDTALAGALSLTARELCQAAKNDMCPHLSQLDEIEVLKGTGDRKAPSNAHATLSRLNDVGNFLNEQNLSSYKVG